MRDLTGDGVSWVECGSGYPIVFLHAMAGSKTAWQPQLDQFCDQYRCIAWDMPGFGQSAPLVQGARMQETVSRLAAFVKDTLHLEKAHFVGLSVGGMILQHFAAEHPELMSSMVIMDSSPKFGFDGNSNANEFAASIRSDLEQSETVEQFCANMVNAIVAKDCSSNTRQQAIASMARASRQGLIYAAQLIAEHDAMAKLKKIAVPALVIAGEQDVETPPDYARKIADELVNATAEIIAGAGHIVNLEQPDAVNALLIQFWSNLSEREAI